MIIECTSFYCKNENPTEYCKECSHANWVVRGKTTFNPRFGFSSVYYYKYYDKWLIDFKKLDIRVALNKVRSFNTTVKLLSHAHLVL